MKNNIIRRPNGNTHASSILISALLSLGVVPIYAVGSLGLLVAWVFSIFHPLIFVFMTLGVALWVGMGLVQVLMLCDIAIGRLGLSLARVVGGILFIFAGWGVAYFIIEDNANSHYYSPLSAWALIAIQCSAVFPPLVPLTSFVLGRGRVLLFVVYFLCYPGLLWWGAVGFPVAVESITHSNTERRERGEREAHLVREHNWACIEKVRAIRELDPLADSQRIFEAHGEVYVPWGASYSYMSFPGLSERDAGEWVHKRRVDIAKTKRDVIETLPDCLDAPLEDGGWRQTRFTEPIRECFDEERRGYMRAFNMEMVRLSEESIK